MKCSVGFTLCMLIPMAAGSASAGEPEICVDAATRAQDFRDDRRLVEAQEQLQRCARQGCPGIVQEDCTRWLGEIEPRVPTIVLSAQDGTGAMIEVRVTADDQLLAERLDGREIPINPGTHAISFVSPAGTRIDQVVEIREGEKRSKVAVHFPRQFPWKVAGYVVGGLGIAGVLVGAGAGMAAISSKSQAGCDEKGFCESAPLSDARSKANASTIAFVAGGILLAAGTGIVLWAGHGQGAAASTWQAAPLAGDGAGGLLLQGRW